MTTQMAEGQSHLRGQKGRDFFCPSVAFELAFELRFFRRFFHVVKKKLLPL